MNKTEMFHFNVQFFQLHDNLINASGLYSVWFYVSSPQNGVYYVPYSRGSPYLIHSGVWDPCSPIQLHIYRASYKTRFTLSFQEVYPGSSCGLHFMKTKEVGV